MKGRFVAPPLLEITDVVSQVPFFSPYRTEGWEIAR
jgi:hypothetical protein